MLGKYVFLNEELKVFCKTSSCTLLINYEQKWTFSLVVGCKCDVWA